MGKLLRVLASRATVSGAVVLLVVLSGCSSVGAHRAERVREFLANRTWNPRAVEVCSGADPALSGRPYEKGLIVAADSTVEELYRIASQVEIRSDWDAGLEHIKDPETYIAICIHDVMKSGTRGIDFDYMVSWATERDLQVRPDKRVGIYALLTFLNAAPDDVSGHR